MKRITVIMALAGLASCGATVEYGSLALVVGLPPGVSPGLSESRRLGERTAAPNVDFSIASFAMVATSTDGETLDVTSGGPVLSLPAVPPGVWDVTVTAANPGGTVVLAGSRSLSVAPRVQTTATVVLAPLDGAGSVNVTVRFPDYGVDAPRVDATLSRPGEEQRIAMECTAGECSGAAESASAGYHVLSIDLLDGQESVVSAVESVRVLASHRTEVEWDFSSRSRRFRGGLSVSVALEPASPIPIRVGGVPAVVYPGEVLLPDASGLPSGAVLSWYLDGNPVEISEITVPTGRSTISITALAETPLAAGSNTVSLEVSSLSPVGGRVFAGSVAREGLSSPREVAVLGDSLFVSDYEREKTWRMTIDASAATVEAESLTLIEDSFGILEATSSSGGGQTGREPIDGDVVWFATSDEIRHFDGAVERTAAVPTTDGRALAVSASVAFLVGRTAVARFRLSGNDLHVAELAGPAELVAADIRAATLDSTGELYVVDFASDSVLRYAVEQDRLALIQLITDGADGIAEMNGPHDVLRSGSDLYVCSYYDDAVIWFRLEPETGMLTFRAAYADVAEGATALAVSHDERTLLVAAGTGDAVAVLNRDPETGELEPVGTIRRDGALDSPRSIALSDGPAFVASANSGAVDVIRDYRRRPVE